MAAKPIYRVVFLNQGKVYEVYARHVSQTGSLFGFVEIEELVFDARKGVVVDPAEERLQDRVRRRQEDLPADALRAADRRGRQAGREQDHERRRRQRRAVSDARLPAADKGGPTER